MASRRSCCSRSTYRSATIRHLPACKGAHATSGAACSPALGPCRVSHGGTGSGSRRRQRRGPGAGDEAPSSEASDDGGRARSRGSARRRAALRCQRSCGFSSNSLLAIFVFPARETIRGCPMPRRRSDLSRGYRQRARSPATGLNVCGKGVTTVFARSAGVRRGRGSIATDSTAGPQPGTDRQPRRSRGARGPIPIDSARTREKGAPRGRSRQVAGRRPPVG